MTNLSPFDLTHAAPHGTTYGTAHATALGALPAHIGEVRTGDVGNGKPEPPRRIVSRGRV
jgi:hypothetical protein